MMLNNFLRFHTSKHHHDEERAPELLEWQMDILVVGLLVYCAAIGGLSFLIKQYRLKSRKVPMAGKDLVILVVEEESPLLWEDPT